MFRILKFDDDFVYLSHPDGRLKKIDRKLFDFDIKLGDRIDVYQDGDLTVVTPAEVQTDLSLEGDKSVKSHLLQGILDLFLETLNIHNNHLGDLKKIFTQLLITLFMAWSLLGVAGLVTFEDLLEEIVGEIDDETDKTSVEVREIGENTYIVEGAMTLNDFNEHFDTELESDDVDTIAGYYLTGVGAIPTQEVKEHYAVINKDKHLEFINDKVKDGRVTKLKVIITAAPEEAEE